MRVVLVATYELGRQPFGLASAAAWLRANRHDVVCIDSSREAFEPERLADVRLVAFHVPMHTATRLALPLVAATRRAAPHTHVCAFGLYAPMNALSLRNAGVDSVLGPEFEADLCEVASALQAERAVTVEAGRGASLPRLQFRVPDRYGLPPLARYARLVEPRGAMRVAGATEASRGCRHRCRHCPIVPVYDGTFRVVPRDVVVADIDRQVELGATHITFGDPDFFNSVTHAVRVIDAVRQRHPTLTWDATIKVEHLRRHRAVLPTLAESGCAFITTAFESFDDAVLERLEKGHTVDDAQRVLEHCREIGLGLAPTFVAFTPWTTRESYGRFLEAIEEWDLIGAVAPVQLALRLLIPSGSALLALPEVAAWAMSFDPRQLAHAWRHRDPAIDRMADAVLASAGRMVRRSRREAFDAVVACAAAHGVATHARADPGRTRVTEIATVDEPWYC